MTSHLQFPTVYLLPAHLETEELHGLEEQVPTLTYDPREADVIVGNITKPARALFELRRHEIDFAAPGSRDREEDGRDAKRRKISDSEGGPRTLKVVRLGWLTESLGRGEVLPLDEYLVLEVERDGAGGEAASRSPRRDIISVSAAAAASPAPAGPPAIGRRHRGQRRDLDAAKGPPPLLHRTTSEEATLPPVPDFLHTQYSCQRPTPVNPSNADFIEELKSIRRTRTLIGDPIGVRAYSSSIASLAAYPYPLQSPVEVARLPGCGRKIADLYREWKNTGKTREADQINSDPRLATLALFYDIWGVGDVTAREFYNKGWRDLDDVVEYGWNTLTRVQQIGVKYYEDLKQGIPRDEVEYIASAILERARAIDPGFELTIVGGYRRGKPRSGDVDVVVSHRDEAQTHFFIGRLVVALERAGLVTHTLSLGTRNSDRGQEALAWRAERPPGSRGAGFDTLDKAMLVWRTPRRLGPGGGDALDGAARPHRRVDVIVSPWKTVGCAIIGWTGGTTFQRDLRRYCKVEKGLKFDSSGIRRRADGTWMDFEGGALGKSPDMETSERRVFSGLGLEWRSPEERCTG